MKNKLNVEINIKEKFENYLNEYKFLLKPFCIISIIFLISILGIIRADVNYLDDLKRVYGGTAGLENFSRYASTYLARFIHASRYLSDVSPLPQILSVFVLGLAGIIVLYAYKKEKTFSFWDIAALIPLGISPFFLQNISFKYDSIYMAISILAGVFPIIFKNKNVVIYSVAIILSSILICVTYQASSGIFIMLVLLIALKEWNDGESFKKILKFLLISFGNYLIGLLIFKLFIMQPISKSDDYVSNTIFPINEIIPGTISNLYEYFRLILYFFKTEWLVLIGVMCVFFVYVFVKETKRKKYISFIVTTFVLALMLIASFGLYSVLTKPLFSPRSMYGFGIFIALIGIVISNNKKAYIGKISLLILGWMFIVFSFTYGNALKAQYEYDTFRVNLVIQDLNDLDIFNTNERKYVQISGESGQAPVIRHMPKNFTMLRRIVPGQFKGNTYVGSFYFYNYFGLKERNIVRLDQNSKDLTELNLPILKETMYHTIKGEDNYILIELK